MDPETCRELRKRQRMQSDYPELMRKGNPMKKFKKDEIDLVKEFWEDRYQDTKEAEEDCSDEELEPFNLKTEREAQSFAETKEAMSRQDREERNDFWLDTIDDLKLAKPVKKPEVNQTKEINVSEVKNIIKRMLKQGEAVSQALTRLRGPVALKKNFKKNVRKSQAETDTKDDKNLSEFNELVKATSDLIGEGIDDVYSWTLDDLDTDVYWKLKGPQGIVGPLNLEVIQKWTEQKRDFSNFTAIQTNKKGIPLEDSSWIPFNEIPKN
ncbi:unnamed protein product [Blepharisma stoltei]|uniref:GYF domain-containing protein n=1 Tax=Blepharisma stoltei TaxID=1481888 RepID=A0AAU9KPS1_9CILI|nr:unnamed protein product [Blepharisma stoltei]